MAPTNEPLNAKQVARIAVYDDLLSAPRVVDIPPSDVATYIESIASTTWEMAGGHNGPIPYTVIREVSENFIHAQFKEITVSVLDHGCTIRFADQGPGIADKEHVQLPGFSSATNEMKEFIRGVGSGLPLVKEYLKFSNGRLLIEDNIKDGTVITIAVDPNAGQQPVVYQEAPVVEVPAQAASYMQPVYNPLPLAQQAGMEQFAAQQMGTASATTAQAAAFAGNAAMMPAGSANNASAAMTPAFQQVAQTPMLEDRDRDILGIATEIQPLGPTDVFKSIGVPVATASRALGKLSEMGYLMPDTRGRGKYLLTQLGLQVLMEG